MICSFGRISWIWRAKPKAIAPRTEPPEAISSYSLNLSGVEVNRFCKETGIITPINLPSIVASRVNIISKTFTFAALIDKALMPR